MLRKEEIFGAQLFDGGVQRVIVEKDGAEDAALRFEIVGQRAFESCVAWHDFRFFVVAPN